MTPLPALSARVRLAIDTATPRLREAIEAALLRFAIHPRQEVSSGRSTWHYTELCAAYIETMIAGGYATALRGWNRLREAIGWWEVAPKVAEEVGARLRPLTARQRHGRHILLDPTITDTLRELVRDLGLWEDAGDDRLQWHVVSPTQRGRTTVCCCPFHDDRHPSMLLDPQRRRATCLACGTTHRLDPVSWLVSGGIKRGLTALSPMATRSIQGQPPVAPSDGAWTRGTLSRAGLTQRSAEGDLLAILATPSRHRCPAPLEAHRRDADRKWPDLVASLDAMEPTEWRGVSSPSGARWLPRKWRPTRTRFVLVDYDGADWGPLEDDLVEVAAKEIEAWAGDHPLLSGRVSVVRTSLEGVQVVLELVGDRSPEWRRTREAHDLHDEVDAIVVAALERLGAYGGGHADPAARGASRNVRRPGPRIKRDPETGLGRSWVARLVHITETT